jgi:hypothetical protein
MAVVSQHEGPRGRTCEHLVPNILSSTFCGTGSASQGHSARCFSSHFLLRAANRTASLIHVDPVVTYCGRKHAYFEF